MRTTITCSGVHGFQPGDLISFTGLRQPWWVRAWHWVTRRRPPVYRVGPVSQHMLTVDQS